MIIDGDDDTDDDDDDRGRRLDKVSVIRLVISKRLDIGLSMHVSIHSQWLDTS